MSAPIHIDLEGLEPGAPQVWRGIRIVPLRRAEPIEDLRLDRRCYADPYAEIELDKKTSYWSYVPHAFVARWSQDGSPAPARGTQISAKPTTVVPQFLRRDQRMVRREDRRQLRFLPLHTALEGYLALHFKGPPATNYDYTRSARTYGLSPREEAAWPAHWIPDLEDAVRFFEVQTDQVGALYFVADALATAFVVPHPEDYRRLHRSTLVDSMGDLLYHYGCAYREVEDLQHPFDHRRIGSLADLRAELSRTRSLWQETLSTMTHPLTVPPHQGEKVYKLGPYRMDRFLPEFRPGGENHIGEIIRGRDGETAYLKTFRLSEAQTKRGHLLSQLAHHDWDLDRCAAAFGQSVTDFALRVRNAGFDDLIEPHARR